MWLGPKEIRKWFALVCLRDMAADKPNELTVQGITRAKMGESLSAHVKLEDHASDLFLMGVFSVLDALLDKPMSEILPKLPIDPQVKSALLGEPCPFRSVHDLILSHERAQWDAFSAHAEALGLREDLVPPIFNSSVEWAANAFTLSG